MNLVICRYRKSLCLIILFFITATFAVMNTNAQTKKDLEERKSKTQEEIKYAGKLLDEARESRKVNLQRIKILNKRIQLRNEIIEGIESEISIINDEIRQKNKLIERMEKDIEILKDQYAEMIVKTYWNRDKQSWLMFVMSSESFNQAYRRMRYLQQFTKHRKEQAELINNMRNELVKEIEELEKIKVQKESLVLEKRNENHNLEKEKLGKNRIVTELTKREKELREEIRKKKTVAEKLEKEIAAIIAEEARKDRSRNIYDQLTPEEKLISDNFQENKGKLPWPVERGIITEKYGLHQHPVLKQVTMENDGIDISTVKGATARAMFEGEVTKIVSILGRNYTVIVRHGNFLSVYQNIVDLQVKTGEKVKTKQVLGTVFTDVETNNTVLHMQIWKERTKQNPEEWISKK